MRKNVKDSDDKGGGADVADFSLDQAGDPAGGIFPGTGPQDVVTKGGPKNKKAKVGLPWDVTSFYSEQVPERDDEDDDQEEDEQNAATLLRLRNADERTKNMTREEYVFWSDCRQASFTFRKGKRFREWAGFGVVTDSKPNDDIVDILGFLTFEIVQTLTEEALKVKEAEDRYKRNNGAGGNSNASNSGAAAGGDSGGAEGKAKRKRDTGLFDPPEEGRTPIERKHVQEAFRRLQQQPNKTKALRLFEGRSLQRTPLKLVRWILFLCNNQLRLMHTSGMRLDSESQRRIA